MQTRAHVDLAALREEGGELLCQPLELKVGMALALVGRLMGKKRFVGRLLGAKPAADAPPEWCWEHNVLETWAAAAAEALSECIC